METQQAISGTSAATYKLMESHNENLAPHFGPVQLSSSFSSFRNRLHPEVQRSSRHHLQSSRESELTWVTLLMVFRPSSVRQQNCKLLRGEVLSGTITEMRHNLFTVKEQKNFIDHTHTPKVTLHTNKRDEALQPKDVREECTKHQRSRFLKIA